MQTDIFVLDHNPARLQDIGDIEILAGVSGGHAEAGTEVLFVAVVDKIDAVCRTDIHTGVAFNAFLERE